ncbi:hypothetical protein PHET_00552 [Paragonimus heterotremus]|uniref:Uncharacterized protein n=1 Tax=Paragonimus heterotremus TaxID=100268 RepID=A0A8J4SUL2_9TREM|nr:hypothetical protein PHET_00552 [Paragonimus heterotremus]
MVGHLVISQLGDFRRRIWFGTCSVDSTINQLANAAGANDSRRGPVYPRGKSFRVVLLQDSEIVDLRYDGGLRITVRQRWRCKTTNSSCLDKLSKATLNNRVLWTQHNVYHVDSP